MQLIAGLLIIVIILLLWIAHFLYHMKKDDQCRTDDDPTGKIKQEIADKLDKAIADIKSTV